MKLRAGGTMGWVAKGLLRALGILALLAMLFAISMGHLSLWLVAAASIAVAVWATNWRRAKKSSARSAATADRLRARGVKRMRKGKRTGKVKPYSPRTMPLGLAKNIRTGDPAC